MVHGTSDPSQPSVAKRLRSGSLVVPVTYRKEWQDGFGARSWKLDAAANDRMVIASTSYTGEKIATSVLVHDLLDHCVSGFEERRQQYRVDIERAAHSGGIQAASPWRTARSSAARESGVATRLM